MKALLFLFTFFITIDVQAQYHFADTIAIEKGEHWFGGAVDEGVAMPFANGYSLNLYGNNKGNQAAPLLLSTNGRFLWSEQPFQFSLFGNQLLVQSIDKTGVEKGGATLAQAYNQASKNIFRLPANCPIRF
jgi:alpha-glucosidase